MSTTTEPDVVAPTYLTYHQNRNLLTGLGELNPEHGILYLEPSLLPTDPAGRILLPVVKLITRIYGEPLRTVLSEPEMNQLLTETGWTEQTRTTGHDLHTPGPAANSIYVRLHRTPSQ